MIVETSGASFNTDYKAVGGFFLFLANLTMNKASTIY